MFVIVAIEGPGGLFLWPGRIWSAYIVPTIRDHATNSPPNALKNWLLQTLHRTKPRSYKRATVIWHMGPCMDPLISKGSRLLVVGNDGHPVAKILYPWRWFLRRWAHKGCDIYYLAIEPTERTRSILAGLSSKLPNFFPLEVVSADSIKDEEDRLLIDRLRTFHPILLSDSAVNSRAMWIEHYHPPKSAVAQWCEFVPNVSEKDERFQRYEKSLEYVIENYGSPIAA